MAELITAVEMAKGAGVSNKAFRARLRAAGLRWHVKATKWTVPAGGVEHRDMARVLAEMTRP